MLKKLSSITFKNHSEQPPEEDELDPTSRLDSTCLIFVQNFISVWNSDVKSLVWNESLKSSNLHAKKETLFHLFHRSRQKSNFGQKLGRYCLALKLDRVHLPLRVALNDSLTLRSIDF